MEQELIRQCSEIASKWATDPIFDEATHKAVQEMLDAEDKTPLIDSFYQTLEFGTGGLRGIMGAGCNRMYADLYLLPLQRLPFRYFFGFGIDT